MNNLLKSISAIHAGNVLDSMRLIRTAQVLKQQKMTHTLIIELLNAAVHGTTQLHAEPWVFVVVQDIEILTRLCRKVEAESTGRGEGAWHLNRQPIRDPMRDDAAPDVAVSKTLIAICGKPSDQYVSSDSWQAGRNLMVAACARGLNTSIFSQSIATLNSPEWKKELAISADINVFVPIMISQPRAHSRAEKHPDIISWK